MRQPESGIDEYSRQQAIQNAGGTCEHCGSAMGHKVFCPLIVNLPQARFKLETSSFYRPEHFEGTLHTPERFVATMHTPELVLTAEDERFLHEINQAFS